MVGKVIDLGHVANSGRPALAVQGDTLYAGLDQTLVKLNLESGAITTSALSSPATAMIVDDGQMLGANDRSMWRIGSTEAPVQLPATLGTVESVIAV